MGWINVEAYRDEISRLLQRHGLKMDNVEFVDGFPGGHLRVSRCYKIEKKIQLKRAVTAEEHEARIASLNRLGGKGELVRDPLAFVKQTLLFEVCHILYRYKNDDECNLWALYEMRF